MRGGKAAPTTMADTDARVTYQEVLGRYQDELHKYTLVVQKHGIQNATTQHAVVQYWHRRLQRAWKELNPIRLARRAQHLSVQALAAATQSQVSPPTIQSWENGAVQFPSITRMKALAQVLDIPDLREQWEAWHALLTSVPSIPAR